jgi:plasmid stability protein
MAQVLVRNLPDNVHRALRVRAASHGRSTAAELRHIITETVLPQQPVADEPIKLGTFLSQGNMKLTDEEFAIFESAQVSTPVIFKSVFDDPA